MLTFFAIVVLAALAVEWLSLRFAGDHRNIRYECKPSVQACEPGEEFLVLSNVANLGRRPSPSIRIEEHFPKSLNVLESDRFNVKWYTKEHRIYYSTVLMRGHQRIRRSLRASILQRGEYFFPYADFYAGDFLGFHEYSYRMENDSSIVIYPAKLRDTELSKNFSDALEDLSRKKQLLEDPISVCGYRDYTGTEPMRQISWKQSAARNALIVKQFDPVRQVSVLIALDTDLHGDFDGYLRQLEYCFSLARTVCEQLEVSGIGYRFVTNAAVKGGLTGITSTGGMGGSFNKILYALGSAKAGSSGTTEELMHAACFGPDRYEMIVLISTHCDGTVETALGKARELRRVHIITLYADQLMPADGDTSAREEAEA